MNIVRILGTTVLLLSASCGSGDEGGGASGDPQLPTVTSEAALASWIAEAHYKNWKCEAAVHDARSPSPHGKNRICSNDIASAHGNGEYPVGAASVKELYDQSGANVSGYSVAVKVAAGGGEAWHWYEAVGSRVLANGRGSEGPPKTVCVGCHAGAGIDAEHSGHDLVYTQVR